MYTWIALYNDGSTFGEHGDIEHSTGQIDKAVVSEIHLVPLVEGLPVHVIEIHPPDERLIAFARRSVVVNEGGSTLGSNTVWVMGWQRTDGGRNHKTFMLIYPNGSVRVSSQDD